MKKVVSVATKRDFVLSLVFDDGLTGDVSLADRLFGPVFEPLADPVYFSKASVDPFGVVSWPNGADIDTHSLYARVAAAKSLQTEPS